MRRELGKWLMDIAKYITTVVILASIFAGLETKWLLYVGSVVAASVTLGFGLTLVKDFNKEEK
ncbi:MAG: hypothetical protein J6V17_02020 [Bacteroidales bacterium]|nr:hypothetical protein [Bacteroidales bacterium]